MTFTSISVNLFIHCIVIFCHFMHYTIQTADRISGITNNSRLAFGSYNDKNLFPFTAIVSDTYAFRHSIDFTDDITAFSVSPSINLPSILSIVVFICVLSPPYIHKATFMLLETCLQQQFAQCILKCFQQLVLFMNEEVGQHFAFIIACTAVQPRCTSVAGLFNIHWATCCLFQEQHSSSNMFLKGCLVYGGGGGL